MIGRAPHTAGVTDPPLREQTIGAAFDRTAEAFAEREALVVPFQGLRLTYPGAGCAGRPGRPGTAPPRARQGRPGGDVEPQQRRVGVHPVAAAKVGVILVNINPAYQREELRHALAQSGCRALVSATGFKSSDYAAMLDDVRASLPDLEHVVFLDTPGWDALLAAGDRSRRRPFGPQRIIGQLRPHQHPVHQRHDGVPEGRHLEPPQPAQQRVLPGRGVPLHRGGPGVRPGALPLNMTSIWWCEERPYMKRKWMLALAACANAWKKSSSNSV